MNTGLDQILDENEEGWSKFKKKVQLSLIDAIRARAIRFKTDTALNKRKQMTKKNMEPNREQLPMKEIDETLNGNYRTGKKTRQSIPLLDGDGNVD